MDRKKAAIVRRMKESGGIRVCCMICDRRDRHMVGQGERLADRKCEACGGRMRPAWWIKKHPHRAFEEKRRLRGGHFEESIR